jgi:uncharacterized protein YjbJ (UPF0337 family)
MDQYNNAAGAAAIVTFITLSMPRMDRSADGSGIPLTGREEHVMNRDELEGKIETVKGRVKQATGTLTNNPDLHDEGVADEVAGKTRETVGRVSRKVGEAIRDIGNALKK